MKYLAAQPMATVSDTSTGKVVGEPYPGKPDVRFDEGTKGSRPWWGLRHRHEAKAGGNGYSPHLKLRTEVLVYGNR